VTPISNAPIDKTLYTTLLVAFDPADGEVYGTFAHGSLQHGDVVGLARSRGKFLADLAHRAEQKRARIELLELALEELPPGCIQRVDPRTRKLLTTPHRH
jgi:hypothetical protein